MARESTRTSDEFAVIHANGEVSDAELHEAILAEGDEDGAVDVTREMCRREGWSEERIARFYPRRH
jgi:hypothetical protein